jgi:DNA-3-methyladenine glycosylase
MPCEFISPGSYPPTTLETARWLLGKQIVVLEYDSPQTSPDSPVRISCSGLILETEAYVSGDPASHAFRGKTARNASMFLDAGHWYVYRIYGIHHCLNLVTAGNGAGEAVLIRAVYPLAGQEAMARRRGLKGRGNPDVSPDPAIANGPGKVCQAMGIFGDTDGRFSAPMAESTRGPGPYLCHAPASAANQFAEVPILQTPRIGISKNTEYPGRFCFDFGKYVGRSPLR